MSQVKSKLREGAPKSSGKNSLFGTPIRASSVALDQLAAFLQGCRDTHRAPDQGQYQAYIRNLDNHLGSEGLDACLLVKEYVDANPGIDVELGVNPLKWRCKLLFDAAGVGRVQRWLVSGSGEDEAKKRVEALDWAWDTKSQSEPLRAIDAGLVPEHSMMGAESSTPTAPTASFEPSSRGSAAGDGDEETERNGGTIERRFTVLSNHVTTQSCPVASVRDYREA
jgi:hypothetical protein